MVENAGDLTKRDALVPNTDRCLKLFQSRDTRVWDPACNVTKRQLMPPPRLPRHLRPCRRLWSAQQVRFASDSPSTGGGDASKAREKPQDDVSNGSASYATTKRLRINSRNGRWKREVRAQESAGSTNSTYASTPTLKIHKHLASQDNERQVQLAQRRQAGASLESENGRQKLDESPSTGPQLKIQRYVVNEDTESFRGAITSYLDKKNALQKEQQIGVSKETEDELREKLKKLEEQLGMLQKKLEAAETAETAEVVKEVVVTKEADPAEEPNVAKEDEVTASPEPSDVPDTAKGQETELVETESTETESIETSAGQTDITTADEKTTKVQDNTLAQQTQAQSSSIKSSHQRSRPPAPRPPRAPQPPRVPQPPTAPQQPTAPDQVSEQSLLDELFPEASSQAQPIPTDRRPSPPKLDLPLPDSNPHIRLTPSDTRTDREKAIDAFRARGETTTILQLSNCSTALTDADFRRLIPRGLHIESWTRDGSYYLIIPGRDPLSLERLPFYYLLFSTPESALAYQKNASRLSKLSALHAPNGIHSAVAPPRGFLEDGEDIAAVTRQFVLHPQGHALDLRTVMQPYNPALRALVDAGGYPPIVPNTDAQGRKIHRVLMHIDGYEPSHWDLWHIISRHAYARGIIWPFRGEQGGALRRLRDCLNLKTVAKVRHQDVASSNPRAAASSTHRHSLSTSAERDTDTVSEFEDPHIAAFLHPNPGTTDSEDDAKQLNQLVMNRVYNRWIVEFEDEDSARRFAGLWDRVVLPEARGKGGSGSGEGKGAWREEEERWVGCEYLW